MALIKSGNYMGLPMNIQRGNPIPLDDTSVWYAEGLTGAPEGKIGFTAMQTYATSGATAYVGQVLTYVDILDATTNPITTTATAYLIADSKGTLVKLAATTASGGIDAQIKDLQEKVTAAKAAADEAKSAADAAQVTADSALDEAGKKVETITAKDDSINVERTEGAVSLNVKLDTTEGNGLKLVSGKGLRVDDPTVELVTAATTSGMLKTYELKQFGKSVGTIDIPKDFLVKSGSVKTVTEADKPYTGAIVGDKYIELILNAKEDEVSGEQTAVYIPVKDLVDAYTGEDGTKIKVTVDENNVIKAEIKAGTIEKTDLAQAVQDTLGKADSAIQSVSLESGENNGTLKLTVGKTVTDNIAVTGLGSAAYKEDTAFDAAGAAKAVLGTEDDAVTEATVYGVKKALAEAKTDLSTNISKKVDKLTSLAGSKPGVYTDNGSGTIVLTEVATAATANTIAKRDANGRITVAEPAADTDAATKKYVDDQVTAINTSITEANYVKNASTDDGLTIIKDDTISIESKLIKLGNQDSEDTPHITINAEDGMGMFIFDTREFQVTDSFNNKTYIDVNKSGELSLNHVVDPTVDADAANKKYVDTKVNEVVSAGITVEESGTGNVITGVSKTDGKITATKGTLGTADITGLDTALGAKASTAALETAKTDLQANIDKKQDSLKYYEEGTDTVSITAMTNYIGTSRATTTYVGETNATVYISGVVTPTNDNDAANKKYVDEAVAGLTDALDSKLSEVAASNTYLKMADATNTYEAKFDIINCGGAANL